MFYLSRNYKLKHVFLENPSHILGVGKKFADHCLNFICIHLDGEDFKRKSRRRRKASHSLGEYIYATF